MFELDYIVEKAGWAVAKASYEGVDIEMSVSYLHDSLKELAETTLQMVNGGNSAKVVFMDEPGEHQIIFKKQNAEEIQFTIRWYDGYESEGTYPSEKYKTILEGTCTLSRLKHQVTNILWNILESLGEDRYLELWGEHEFPKDLYKKLNTA